MRARSYRIADGKAQTMCVCAGINVANPDPIPRDAQQTHSPPEEQFVCQTNDIVGKRDAHARAHSAACPDLSWRPGKCVVTLRYTPVQFDLVLIGPRAATNAVPIALHARIDDDDRAALECIQLRCLALRSLRRIRCKCGALEHSALLDQRHP